MNEEYFSVGYLCEKCFMLVEKRTRLRNELHEIEASIVTKLRTASSLLGFDTEQGSFEVVRGSIRTNQVTSQGSTPK